MKRPGRLLIVVGAGVLAVASIGTVLARSSESPGPSPEAQASPTATPKRPPQEPHGILADVAKVLGMDPKDLLQQLRDGQTLKQAIEAKGKTVDDVVNALVAQRKAQIDQSGKLNADQEKQALDRYQQMLHKLLEGPTRIPAAGQKPQGQRPHPDQKSNGGPGKGRGPGGPGILAGGIGFLNNVATALGLDPKAVIQQLHDGKTPKEIITAAGKTVDDVVNAVLAAAKTKLDPQVTAGKLTADQEQKLLDGLAQKVRSFIENPPSRPQAGPGFGPFGGKGGPRAGQGRIFKPGTAIGAIGDLFNSVAQALGLDPKAVMQQLRDGKTPKEIIAAAGKTVDDVVNAVLAAAKAKLDQQVTAGKLTADQEQKLLDQLAQKVRQFIENPPPHGAGPGGHSSGKQS